MENPEEILHCLEEFSKFRPKDIPRELEDYLSFVAKTGDPVYQWGSIKQLFKEKLINVVTEFYETCPSVEIPPCPNVDIFNYDTMKSFILEKLETFSAAPFTVQRICELLTTPRKEYNRIDKFMRALEKNILVVSTVEPGCKGTENGESIVNGLESEHLTESNNSPVVEEMEESPVWHKTEPTAMQFQSADDGIVTPEVLETFLPVEEEEVKEPETDTACSSSEDNVTISEEAQKEYVEIEAVPINSSVEESTENVISLEVNVDPLPTQVEDEISSDGVSLDEVTSEPVVSSEIADDVIDEVTEAEAVSSADSKELLEETSKSEETNVQDSLKQADSTTNTQSPQTEPVPTVCEVQTCSAETIQPSVPQEIQDSTTSEIASSDNEPSDADTNSKELPASAEPDTVNELPSNDAETDSSEAKEVNHAESEDSVSYDEDSNSSPADTTKGLEPPSENVFKGKIEENKEEEISSSDKAVVTVPNASIDDISDDESEAEAEVQKASPEETKDDVPPASETPEDDTMVTASSDDLKKDCEETPMDVDSKEKGDFNEAEAACESV